MSKSVGVFSFIMSDQSLPVSPEQVQPFLARLDSPALILDEQLRVQAINPAAQQQFQINESRAVGQPIQRVLPDLSVNVLHRLLGDSNAPTQLTLQHGGRGFEGQAVLLQAPRNKTALAVILLDITPYRQQMAEDNQLLRLVIHDLLNMINIPLTQAEMLHEGLIPPEEIADTQRASLEYLRRMHILLNDLRALEQAKADMSVTFERLDLTDLIEDVLNQLQRRAADLNIRLEFSTPHDPLPRVVGNRTLLRQAVLNLVENGIKYTPPGGWVRVTLSQQDTMIEVAVTDNGLGIPQEKQARLFTPFYRVDDPRTADISGTGMGLSLVQMAVQRHQGEVRVDSEVGRGSTFAFRLPLMHA